MIKSRLIVIALSSAWASGAFAVEIPGRGAGGSFDAVGAPRDRAYPGEIRLSVDATDLERRIVRVRETVSGIGADTVLLYPKWLPGTHAPEGPIDKLAGIRITASGAPVSWTRDPLDVYALRIHPGSGVQAIDIEFEYLSATNTGVGAVEISHNLALIDWNTVVLYPAGYFARRIGVAASLTLPTGWRSATSLEIAGADGARTNFKPVTLETLIDSPVYAGRFAARLDLDPGSAVPVNMDLFADREELLAVRPEQLAAHRALVQQSYKLFGSHHFAHYDFLYSLSEQIEQMGLEHHQSSEDGADPEAFTEWDKYAFDRDLLAHEFTHSWNGKFRRPADLWTANYNVPMQNSLLWVYEGQTQYWGQVLAARSGLRTRQEALDEFALTAAYYDSEAGREWRPLQDTTNDEIINPRRPQSWRNWQRFEDYYSEAALVWLDVDTLIRDGSGNKRSLDDFARAFFGINDGSSTPVTYTFDDIVKGLDAVLHHDWRAYLRRRLDATGIAAPLDGLQRGGYQLIYTDTPSDYERTAEVQRKRVDLMYSIGLEISDKDDKGSIVGVRWGGPAFKAKLTDGGRILAVNGIAYGADVIKDAIRAANSPIQLIVKTGDRFIVADIDYRGGLRYPHLQREPAIPALLDAILEARP